MNHPLELFRFCPKCGSENFEINNALSRHCSDCGFTYYQNPRASTAAFILNSKGELLVVRRAKDPQKGTLDLPGGFVDNEESAEQGMTREIKEETGIDVSVTEDPFLCIKTYDNNYFGTGKKVLNSIYYYRFFTDDMPNFQETHYDELELSTDFNLYYVNFCHLKDFLLKSMNDGSTDINIGREMLCVVDEYDKMFGGNL